MKAILATTDFSAASRNAVIYAAELAKNLKTKLILMHAYSVPVMAEAPLPVATLDQLENDCGKRLRRMAAGLHRKFGPRLSVEIVCKCGFAVDAIKESAKEFNADLIIMGMQGAGYLAEKLNGSVTTSLISESDRPVMSIDKRARFKTPKRIVFASDLKELGHTAFVNFLEEFTTRFKSKLMVLNIFKPESPLPKASEAVEGLKLEHLLKNIRHDFYYAANKDVVKGISDFVKENKVDMVVMVPRKHNLFENLLHEPQSRRMAFHTSVPLLTFHN